MLKTIHKILFFLNETDKKKLFFILSFIFLMGLVELAGLVTLLPFLAVLAKTEVINSNDFLSMLYLLFGFSSPKMFMLFLGAGVLSVLVFGNVLAATMTWFIYRFCYEQGKKISCSLLEKYLSQPYVFFLNHHTSDLSKSILSDVDRVVIGIFINSIQSLTKLVLLICIFGMLIVVEPILALVVITVLGGAYLIIFGLLRKKILQAGKISCESSSERYKLLQETFGVVKELKILGNEKNFLQKFEICTTRYSKAETISQLAPSLTRYAIEAIAFGGMVLIALYLIATKEEITKFLPLLGLYALAGYRLMPAMQQLFNGVSLLKYQQEALNILYREMQIMTLQLRSFSEKLPFNHELKLNHVSYTYPMTGKNTLSDVSFTIRRCQTVGFVGTTGAGKTTLIDVILGLLDPFAGKLEVDEVEINKENIQAWRRNIGYVPQNIFLLDATITQNIALGVNESEINLKAVEQAAKLANLHEFISQELKQGYNTIIGEKGVRLSGGQRQRIGIARALYHDPELLIFDEATSALDTATEKAIMEAIKNLSHRKTILLIAHRLNTVKDCDVIYFLNKGLIIDHGSYEKLIRSNHEFRQLAILGNA